jgi:glutamate-1-semialdehyde 2,1-aminomutase
MILGHAYEPVVQAVIEKVRNLVWMPTELETQIAALAVAMVQISIKLDL